VHPRGSQLQLGNAAWDALKGVFDCAFVLMKLVGSAKVQVKFRPNQTVSQTRQSNSNSCTAGYSQAHCVELEQCTIVAVQIPSDIPVNTRST